MRTMERVELLKDTVQQAIDNGATNVEQVHQYIAALPFETLEKLGFFEEKANKLKGKQADGIGIAMQYAILTAKLGKFSQTFLAKSKTCKSWLKTWLSAAVDAINEAAAK